MDRGHPGFAGIGRCGRIMKWRHIMKRFGLSYVRTVYFYISLQSFMTCGRIFKELLLLLIYHKLPSIANHCHIPYFLPDRSPIAPQSNYTSVFTLQFLILLSGWRYRTVFLSLECLIYAVKILPCLRVCKLEPYFKDSLSCSCSLFSK